MPNAVNIQVSSSYPKRAIPVGLPGTGVVATTISRSVPGGIRSSWLEYTTCTVTLSSAGLP